VQAGGLRRMPELDCAAKSIGAKHAALMK